MTLENLIVQLKGLNSHLLTLGRLNFVELLLQDSIDLKLRSARKGFSFINYAINIESGLFKSLNQKKENVKWDDGTINFVEKIIRDKNLQALEELKVLYEESCANIISILSKSIKEDHYLTQFLDDIISITNVLICKKGPENTRKIFLNTNGNDSVKRVIYGPSKMNIDKIFRPSDSILAGTQSEFGDLLEELVPYFWSLSLREILASELCALSLIEYDNLPCQFYWDFAKQSCDEARHSNLYLDLSLSLFQEIEPLLAQNNQLKKIIADFRATKVGLPVPKEKNMYEAVLNAELEERLILMNILTEAPAIARLTKKMKKDVCVQYPEIKELLAYDKVDEIFHARIGSYWLKYLIPNSEQRKQKINDTKLLRGFLLLTSISEYSTKSLKEMAEDLI